MTDEQEGKPKIIVDDDWKERVQAEKEALQKEKESEPESESQTTPEQVPPASFSLLVTSLATQALAEMGQIPDPSGKAIVRLDHAKHVIDTLGVLEEKTRGNLTPEEEAMLSQILHELRMGFVAIGQNPSPADTAVGEQPPPS